MNFSAILKDCNANGIEGGDWRTAMKGLWFSPAVRILLSHRIQYRLKKGGGGFRAVLARMLWMRSVSKWGCDIGNQAEIAPGITLPHTVGIVIGNFVTIEAGCTIFQGVTLGDSHGKTPGRPTIRAGSTIYTGACVLGAVEVGPNATVGAHALVTEDVPSDGVVFLSSPSKTKPQEKKSAA